ncbi:hypothetical protein C8Q77DRAFT_645959 [Trametes polyzona]|nr:hypothetical protein C8Q77DRAFT_645959 [Trametes polyzona]
MARGRKGLIRLAKADGGLEGWELGTERWAGAARTRATRDEPEIGRGSARRVGGHCHCHWANQLQDPGSGRSGQNVLPRTRHLPINRNYHQSRGVSPSRSPPPAPFSHLPIPPSWAPARPAALRVARGHPSVRQSDKSCRGLQYTSQAPSRLARLHHHPLLRNRLQAASPDFATSEPHARAPMPLSGKPGPGEQKLTAKTDLFFLQGACPPFH